jgi:glycosyltransferase involved in cell wall biosynthesis
MAIALQGRTPRPEPDETGERALRSYLFEDLFERRYNESLLDSLPRRPWERALPGWARLAREVHRRADEYDVVISWSERVSMSLMTLQYFVPGKPHVAFLYWFSRPSVRAPMRAFGSSLHAVVTWSSVQREYAIRNLGIAPEKIYLIKHYVDQLFFRPRDVSHVAHSEQEIVCSAGAEMRDYPTLIEALRGTNLRCHIASDHVRVDRFGFARRVSTSRYAPIAGENVTIARVPVTELRQIYARSRFVVVPLQRSDTDNGVNVILEAMAMGKPVICSRTRGQVDVIQEGVTGLFVPVGDAKALRKAILELWNDPARCREMGRAGRAYIEKHHTVERFVQSAKGAIDASLEGRPARRDGSFDMVSPSSPANRPQAAVDVDLALSTSK